MLRNKLQLIVTYFQSNNHQFHTVHHLIICYLSLQFRSKLASRIFCRRDNFSFPYMIILDNKRRFSNYPQHRRRHFLTSILCIMCNIIFLVIFGQYKHTIVYQKHNGFSDTSYLYPLQSQFQEGLAFHQIPRRSRQQQSKVKLPSFYGLRGIALLLCLEFKIVDQMRRQFM